MARRLISLIVALGVLVGTTAPAAADPITLIGTAIASVLTSTGVAAAVGLTATSIITLTAASNFIAAALLTGAAFLFASSGGARIDPGKAKETLTTAETSELRVVGRARIGGAVAFGSTNLTQRYRLLLQARLLDAYEDFFVGGFEVILDGSNGDVLSRPYRIASTNYIRVLTDLGDVNKAAWSDLVTAFPALITSNHRARGIAQALVRYTSPGLSNANYLKLYQSGIPQLECVVRGEPVYDPREGGQDPDDPSTWAWSDNGVLCVLHVAVQFQARGYLAFDLAQIADAADDADAVVNTLTATEVRSRCWGVWPSEGARGDTLAQILQSTGTELYTTDDGLLGIRLIDDDADAEVSFGARHIISYNWRAGPEGVERPNRLRLKYYSPERRYELAEVDLTGFDWAIHQDEIDTAGEQILDIELPFCPSASQAQRIARRLYATARADRGVIVTNMAGMAAWGCKVIDIEIDDLETTFRSLISPPRCRDGDGTVEIPFIVQPALATWDPSTMEAPAPVEVPEIVYAGASDAPTTPSGTAVVVTYPNASKETRVVAGWSGGSFSGALSNLEPAYRTVNPLPSAWQQMTSYATIGVKMIYVAVDLNAIPSVFRLRGSNSDQENSAWSGEYATTPTVVNTAPASPTIQYDGGIPAIVIVAPTDLHVAYLRVTPPSGPATDHPVRPEEQITFPGPASGTWAVTARSSNGTASGSVSALAP